MARRETPSALRASLAGVAASLVGIGLLVAVLELPRHTAGLTQEVLERMPLTGIEHPVTAVLLAFRGYDTWLEKGVLLLAVIGVLALQRSRDLRAAPEAPASPVLVWLVRFLVPVMVCAGGYLLWLGTHGPGGAFQAGVVLGAAGVLLRLAGFDTVDRLHRWLLHALLLTGFAGFLMLALGLLLAGRPMLDYPQEAILTLEVLIAISVAVSVTALVVGARPIVGPS